MNKAKRFLNRLQYGKGETRKWLQPSNGIDGDQVNGERMVISDWIYFKGTEGDFLINKTFNRNRTKDSQEIFSPSHWKEAIFIPEMGKTQMKRACAWGRDCRS